MNRLGLGLMAVLMVHAIGSTSWDVRAEETVTAPSVSQLQKVRVQLKWRHQFQFAGYYAAIAQGYYRDAGLDVELVEYETGLNPIDQLMGGVVEFAVADTGALIYHSVGVPVVALASIFQHSPSILMTRDDGEIETLADLADRRVMLSGGYMNAELVAMLQSVGLETSDINIVPGDTSIDTLVDGQTDAYNGYLTNEPYGLEQRGIGFKNFVPRDYGVDFYGDTLFTTEALIAKDAKLVEAFRAATLAGWAYAVEHPEEIVDLILRDYNTQGKARDHLMFEARQSIDLILPSVVPIGYMNIERWERIAEVFHDQGRLTGPVELRTFLYPEDDFDRFVDLLYRHRGNIGAVVILLIAGFLLFHIVSLRVQIKASTRELEEAKLQAEKEARTDALTGLPNRRHFFETVERDIARIARNNRDMCIMIADLDYFKEINDGYGHAAGDYALRQASTILQRNVRAGDIAARIGGEEFAFCCLDVSADECGKLAERLRDEMAAEVIEYDGRKFSITLSLGYAPYQNGQSLDDVMQNADNALYDAKKDGRNTVNRYQPEAG